MINKTNEVVCFGEILWDVLPSGAKPGGAPMNVAYHLKKFGHDPATITRVGTDERGAALTELLSKQQISTQYIQEDAVYETGVVTATPDDKGNMTYDIKRPVAWDYIELHNEHEALLQDAAYFIFGSLAARNDTSRNTLFTLIEMANKKVVDINLRAPHFNKKIVSDLFAKADILKLNEDELELVTGWFSAYTNIEDRISQIQDHFNIPTLIVTRGADGAMLKQEGTTYSHPGYKVEVADTVGSGDSFLAAYLAKTMEGVPPSDALAFASAVGAFVASKSGAWPEYDVSHIESFHNSVLANTKSMNI